MDSLKSEKYTYDELNRLLTAQRGTDANIQRKYQYDFDRYGNRWGQNVVAGSGLPGANTFNSSNNRITSTGFSYDGSGNLAANGPGTSFSYNQENFMTAAGTTTYKYDAQGRWVRKTVGSTVTDYFYSGSELVAEKQGSQWIDYIFFGNQRIVKQTGSTTATASYLHTDHLGSTRVCTDSSGASNGTCDYEPFGEVQPGSSCSAPTNLRFAGMEWDADAGPNGLYHTWFRQYEPNQGQWMGVDPLPGSEGLPQSLNRYAYVLNDPLSLVDPLGLEAEGRAIEVIGGCIYEVRVGYQGGKPVLQYELIFCGSSSSSGGGQRRVGGQRGFFRRALQKVVSGVCSVVPDATTFGGGVDLGLFITFGVQVGVVANGRSGQFSFYITGTTSAGLAAFDAYLAGGFVPKAPNNQALSTKGNPSPGIALGLGRSGVNASPNNFQGTFGPSLLPVTAAALASATAVSPSIPYLGYISNWPRAVCKAATG